MYPLNTISTSSKHTVSQFIHGKTTKGFFQLSLYMLRWLYYIIDIFKLQIQVRKMKNTKIQVTEAEEFILFVTSSAKMLIEEELKKKD